MPAKLSTTVAKISLIPNEKNRELVTAFHRYLKENNASERHQNNQLKAAISYTVFLGPEKTPFYRDGRLVQRKMLPVPMEPKNALQCSIAFLFISACHQ